MSEGRLTVRRDGDLAFVTLDNKAKRNALSYDMWRGLAPVLDELCRDSTIRVIILSGAGRVASGSGADIEQFSKYDSADFDKAVEEGLSALDRATKPIICVIHGFCIGGALDVALRCDLRFADTATRFAVPDAKLGLAWGFRGTKGFVAAVGQTMAREMIYTGRMIDANEALRIGLINRLASPDDIESAALDCARRIAANAPLSVTACKMVLQEIVGGPTDAGLSRIEKARRACTESEDFQEGQRAFLERRPPVFQGR